MEVVFIYGTVAHAIYLLSVFLSPFLFLQSPFLSSLSEGWAIWGNENMRWGEGTGPRVVWGSSGGWEAKYRAALEEWCHGLAVSWRTAKFSWMKFEAGGHKRWQNHNTMSSRPKSMQMLSTSVWMILDHSKIYYDDCRCKSYWCVISETHQ